MDDEPTVVVGGSQCFKCNRLAERGCALCGQFFCEDHGGNRLVRADGSQGFAWARTQLTQMVACDACGVQIGTVKRAGRVVVLLILAALVLLMLFGLTRQRKQAATASHANFERSISLKTTK